VNALIAGAAEPFSFVISNRLSRESLPCFCRSRVPSEGEVEGNLLSRSFHSLSRLSRSRKGFVSGYAFRRTVKMHHTDPAPVGRHSESQRPATFTHHETHHCAMSSWAPIMFCFAKWNHAKGLRNSRVMVLSVNAP